MPATVTSGRRARRYAGPALITATIVIGATLAALTPAGFAASCESGPETSCEAWHARYDGMVPTTTPPGFGDDRARDVVAGGGVTVVTGESQGGNGRTDIATVAYDSGTGDELWVAREHKSNFDQPHAIAMSPDAGTVFVTGEIHGATDTRDIYTVAYQTSDGTKTWEAVWGDSRSDRGRDIIVSPDGSTVIVVGEDQQRVGASDDWDAITIAYNPSDGTEEWVSHYEGPQQSFDFGYAVAVGADSVYVAAHSWGRSTPESALTGGYATISYDLGTGAQSWASRYETADHDIPYDVVIGPDGDTVFVTGESGPTLATLGFRTSDGERLWLDRYLPPGPPQPAGPSRKQDGGSITGPRIDVSPAGDRLYVVGETSQSEARGLDITTLSLTAAGTRTAAAIVDGAAGDDRARDIVVGRALGPDGMMQDRVFVTGEIRASSSDVDILVLAYDRSLAEKWRQERGEDGSDRSAALALQTPGDPTRLFSAGSVVLPVTNFDFDVAAYDTTVPGPEPTATATASPSPTASTSPSPTPSSSSTPSPSPSPTASPTGSPGGPGATPTTPSTGPTPDGPLAAGSCGGLPEGLNVPRSGGGRVITGTSGDDVLFGTDGPDLLCGFGGNDRIRGGVGDDRLFGGRGKDSVAGGRGADLTQGNAGADTVGGGRGWDVARGGRGPDRVRGGRGRDRLFGGRGSDLVNGGRGWDVARGGRRSDRVRGGRGRDRLFGGRGPDFLNGGRGRDKCAPGPGRDRVRRC